MRALTAAAVVALALTAGAADAAPGRSINGVNLDQALTAVGTEPFWDLKFGRGDLFFSVNDAKLRGRFVRPRTTRGKAVWTTRTTGGRPMIVTVTSGPCSDGMSERTYPLTVRVVIGPDRYEGCAASKAAFDRFGDRETGEIR